MANSFLKMDCKYRECRKVGNKKFYPMPEFDTSSHSLQIRLSVDIPKNSNLGQPFGVSLPG